MESYFTIGTIVNTQGIKGDMRVMPQTDDITRFELLESVFVETQGKLTEYKIERVWYHKNFVILKLEGVDINAAERLKFSAVKIPESQALELDNDEYYISDLMDCVVVTESGENVGRIVDIMFTGANDVYVIEDENAKGGQWLLPAIKECVLDVNIDDKRMTVHIMPGLRSQETRGLEAHD